MYGQLYKLRYLIYFFLLFPAFVFRDFTPANELKYISIVNEALANGNWFTFYNHGEIYADKPPLYFWLLMTAKSLTGGHYMWIIGLFSLLPALGILRIMDRMVARQTGKKDFMLPEVMLLTSSIFFAGTMVVRMDILMSFFIILSLSTFYRMYSGKAYVYDKWLLPVWIFMGVLSKGVVGILIPLLGIISFLIVKKKFCTFGRYLGWRQWGVIILLSSLWFLGIYSEGGTEYLNNILFKQTVGRGIDSFHHKEPVWFYFPRLLWTFAPWSLLLIVIYWKAARKRMFDCDLKIFMLVTILSGITAMSIVSAKLDIYLLPLYPFSIYLAWLIWNPQNSGIAEKTTLAMPAILFVLSSLCLPFALAKVDYDLGNAICLYIAAAALLVCSVVSLVYIIRNRFNASVIVLGFGLLATVFFSSFKLGRVNRYIGFGMLAQEALEYACQNEDIRGYCYFRYYTAPNMDVYLGCGLEQVREVEELDSIAGLSHSTVLFVRYKEKERVKEFGNWLEGRRKFGSNGKYDWYVIGGEQKTEY